MQLLLARSSFYGKRSICDLSTSTLQTFGDNVKMKFAGANNGSARTHPQWIPKVDEQKENLEQVMTMLKSYGQELMIWHLALKKFNVSRQITVRDLTTMRKSSDTSRTQPTTDLDSSSSSKPSSDASEVPGKEITVVKSEEGKFSTVTVDEDQNLSILKTEELDEFEIQLMDQVAVYLDPETGLAEDAATRKARYTFDGVLRKAFANFQHLISSVPAGDISALLRIDKANTILHSQESVRAQDRTEEWNQWLPLCAARRQDEVRATGTGPERPTPLKRHPCDCWRVSPVQAAVSTTCAKRQCSYLWRDRRGAARVRGQPAPVKNIRS